MPTNKNLREYLQDCMGLTFSDTYASNVFPFIKQGKKIASIRQADMLYAAKTHALPQIEIVSPLMVICLGHLHFTLSGALVVCRIFPGKMLSRRDRTP